MTVKSKKFQKGIITKPTTSATTEEGEIRNDSADNKQKVFTEGAEREIITADQTQELSNKTIDSASNTITVDADEATVENLEVDNLKAGVLETDLTNAVDDTKLPSALAVKTYVADQVATKDEASEITFDDTNVNVTGANVQAALDDVANSAAAAQGSGDAAQTDIDDHIADAADAHAASAITNTPSGNLAATDVQGALDELQTDVDSRALASDLSDHLVDPVDAHDASTISNAPSGNLVATDVQSALDELQGDIDTLDIDVTTAQTTVDNHIADASDAHDASAISNIAAGNLAATNVQDALNELQADVDTRADATDLSNHTGATSGVHGVTGDVVGTTDTQTLTSKTIQGASIENPVRLDPKKDTKANLETYATTATNGELVFATDEKQSYQVVDAELVSIGGSGVGGVDIFHVERFEQTEVADVTTGNNATFLGAGSIAGAVINQEVSPLKGDRSIQYTQAAGSLNDYVALPEVVLDTKEQGNTAGVVVYTTYDGNDNEVDFVVYDNTGTEVIARLPLKRSTKSLKQELIFNIPSSSAGLRYGIQTAVENSGAVLVFDEIEFKLNPLTPTDIYASSDWKLTTINVIGLGSKTEEVAYTRRNGSNLEGQGSFITGTPASSSTIIEIELPDSLKIDFNKITTASRHELGTLTRIQNAVGASPFDGFRRGILHSDKISETSLFVGIETDTAVTGDELNKTIDGNMFADGEAGFYEFSVPIAGWSNTSQGVVVKNIESSDISNTNSFSASIFSDASYGRETLPFIESVTRPSTGNYTITFKSGVFTETPNFTVGGTPLSRFVNVNTIDKDVCFVSISDNNGTLQNDAFSVTFTKATNDYVKESERTVVLPKGIVSNFQSTTFNTLTGFGSTGSAVPYYTNKVTSLSKNQGIYTENNSSVDGLSFTFTQDALVTLSVSGAPAAGGSTLGVSINASSTATALEGLAVDERLGIDYSRDASTVNNMSVSVTIPVAEGDVLRPHGNGLSGFPAQWHLSIMAYGIGK